MMKHFFLFFQIDHDEKRFPRRIEEDKNRNRFLVVTEGSVDYWLMKPITLSPIMGHNSSNPFVNNPEFQPEKKSVEAKKPDDKDSVSKSETKEFIPKDSFDSFVRYDLVFTLET